TGAGLSNGNVRNIGGLFYPAVEGEDETVLTPFGAITRSEVTMWGLGIVQSIDAAAMDLYLGYRNYSGNFTAVIVPTEEVGEEGGYGIPYRARVIVDNNHAVFAGGILRF